MIKNLVRSTLAVACINCIPINAWAYSDEEIDEKFNQLSNKISSQNERLKINGFMSLGGGISNEEADYKGITRHADWEADSVVAIQFDFLVNDKTHVVTQLKGDGSDDFDVNAEWAFIKYRYAPDLTMRAGRLRFPAFLLSEYIDAAYAYPWVKAPVETYNAIPFTSYEGADLIYTFSINDNWNLDFQPYAGTTHFTPAEGSLNAYGSPMVGVDLKLTDQNWTLRAGYSRMKITIDNFPVPRIYNSIINGNPGDNPATPFVEAQTDSLLVMADDVAGLWGAFNGAYASTFFTAYNPPAGVDTSVPNTGDPTPYTENLDGIEGVWSTYAGLGIRYEDDRWTFMSEFNRFESGTTQPDLDQAYAMLGVRFGDFMPHVTISKIETKDASERDLLVDAVRIDQDLINALFALNSGDATVDGLASAFAGTATGYNATYDAAKSIVDSLNIFQESIKVGVRWDASPGVALKVEVEQISDFEGTAGLFNNSPTSGAVFDSSDPDKEVNLIRASVDVLF